MVSDSDKSAPCLIGIEHVKTEGKGKGILPLKLVNFVNLFLKASLQLLKIRFIYIENKAIHQK